MPVHLLLRLKKLQGNLHFAVQITRYKGVRYAKNPSHHVISYPIMIIPNHTVDAALICRAVNARVAPVPPELTREERAETEHKEQMRPPPPLHKLFIRQVASIHTFRMVLTSRLTKSSMGPNMASRGCKRVPSWYPWISASTRPSSWRAEPRGPSRVNQLSLRRSRQELRRFVHFSIAA